MRCLILLAILGLFGQSGSARSEERYAQLVFLPETETFIYASISTGSSERLTKQLEEWLRTELAKEVDELGIPLNSRDQLDDIWVLLTRDKNSILRSYVKLLSEIEELRLGQDAEPKQFQRFQDEIDVLNYLVRRPLLREESLAGAFAWRSLSNSQRASLLSTLLNDIEKHLRRLNIEDKVIQSVASKVASEVQNYFALNVTASERLVRVLEYLDGELTDGQMLAVEREAKLLARQEKRMESLARQRSLDALGRKGVLLHMNMIRLNTRTKTTLVNPITKEIVVRAKPEH